MKYVVAMGMCLALALTVSLTGCGQTVKADPKLEQPPAPQVDQEQGASLVKVEHPEQFPLATAVERVTAPELNVTGVVSADVSRNMPVVSFASGRVVEIHARLGDDVTKGQLLLRVQSADIASAFADYRKAMASQVLARAQLERAQLLYEKGAIAKKDVEVSQDTADKAKVDVETAMDRLRVLGADTSHFSPVIDIVAPVSGVIVEQNVTAASGIKTLDNSPNLFTIADLSHVWIVCDVYENDLSGVRVGEYADIRLNAYPGRTMKGRVSNIGPILDPTIRTTKVRIEVQNPGQMRLGMFVTATFHGQQTQKRAVVPASAILHLHDRDWVYVPAGDRTYRRVEVQCANMIPTGLQEIVSGIKAGDRVVSNALVLQNTAEQ